MATSKDFLEQMLLNTNIQATLKTIRHTEGTSAPDGYNYLFGSGPKNSIRFNSFDAHPHIEEPFGKQFSSAAGAYQILYPTYKTLCEKYGFTDFTPHTQDLMCCAIFDEIDCLLLVANGNILQTGVLAKIGGQWASFPDNNYGQHEYTIDQVKEIYLSNGGIIAA